MIIVGRNNANAYNGPSLPIYRLTAEPRASPHRASKNPKQSTLTAQPRLPVQQTLEDILPPEVLPRGAELLVGLQAPDDDRALRLGEELGRVWEVLDDPEGDEPGDDGGEALDDEAGGYWLV